MKLSRRANTIILWFVSIGLLAGMVITFTPTLGLGVGGNTAGAVLMRVNGQEIRELEVAQVRANPLYLAVTEGEVGADLEMLLVKNLIRNEVLSQEAARQRVTDAEVRNAVTEFRVSRGITGRANDNAYLDLLNRSGYTDETFRTLLRQDLQRQKWESALLAGLEVSDAEVDLFFLSNRDSYLSEERIEARHIVSDSREAAEAAVARLQSGEDAATVAREVSLERADRDGALGAAAGETTPRPVGRAALPTPVATAAFGLAAAGVTPVVESDGRFHVVVVEAYLPAAPRPFEEVAPQVREDALRLKQAGVLEAEIARLVAAARVEFPSGSTLSFDDSVVARVGDKSIMASELIEVTYNNPQIQQALTPENAFIITAFFKPSVLDQMVEQELALLASRDLDVDFFGPRAFSAQSVLSYVTREASVSEAEISEYYSANRSNFTIPASAQVTQVTAADLNTAIAARAALLAGGEVAELGDAVAVEEIGLVTPGRLEALLDLTLFGTDGFTLLPDGEREISDVLVLEADGVDGLPEEIDVEAEPAADVDASAPFELGTAGARYVLLVAQRSPEQIRSLAEVRAQIESTVLSSKRNELRDAFLAEVRESVPVDLLLGDPFGGMFDFSVGDEEADDAGDAEGEDAPAAGE